MTTEAKRKRTPAERATEAAETAARVVARLAAKIPQAEAAVVEAKQAHAAAETRLAYVLAHPDLPSDIAARLNGEEEFVGEAAEPTPQEVEAAELRAANAEPRTEPARTRRAVEHPTPPGPPSPPEPPPGYPVG
jgi:hypothetical protein